MTMMSDVQLCAAGASFSTIVGYVLGYPFLNDTILNETMWMPRQWYDYDDMNISDFMMYMFSSFAKYGCVPLSLYVLVSPVWLPGLQVSVLVSE